MPIEVFQLAEKTLFNVTQGTLGLESLRVEMQFDKHKNCDCQKPEVLTFEREHCARGFNSDPARELLHEFKDSAQGREHLATAWRIHAKIDGELHTLESDPPIPAAKKEKPKKGGKHEEKQEKAPEPAPAPAPEAPSEPSEPEEEPGDDK